MLKATSIFFRKSVREIRKDINVRKYHRRHRTAAYKACQVIQNGNLNESTRKLCDDYAADVLGWKGYSPWLYVYSAIQGSFSEGWIPDNYYGHVVVPAVNGAHGGLSNFRTITARLLADETSPDIAYRINGRVFDLEMNAVSENELQRFLFSENDRIVFKSNNSQQGRGTEVLKRGDPVRSCGSDGVFQYFIEQHPYIKEMSPGAVATLRLTTVVSPSGSVKVRAGYVRLGRAGQSVIVSASSVRVPIAVENGILSGTAYLADWSARHAHPDTGFPFHNVMFPGFDKAKRLAIDLHSRAPFAQSVGWDFAIDSDERPVLMEWNGEHNGIKFTEATQGPCFGDLNWHKLWRVSPSREKRRN